MKKFLALLISLFYLFSFNACYAFSELYYINSSNQTLLKNELDNLFVKKGYTVTKTNPYYAVSNKKSENYIVTQIAPYGNQLLFYYETNNDKKFNKEFLKYCDSNNITYEKSMDNVSLSKISEMTQQKLSGTTKTYDFNYSPNATKLNIVNQTQAVQQISPTTLKGFVGKVGRGTTLNVYLQSAINTATANVGDTITGVLKSDWRVNSYIVAPQGSVITGTLTKASSARAGMRNGSVQINFNRLETPEGKIYNLTTEKIDFDVTNDGQAQKVMTSVATAAAVGAVMGLALALMGSGNYGTNAAIGAGIAGGGALLTQAVKSGVDAEIPSYTDLEVKLLDDINVVINY